MDLLREKITDALLVAGGTSTYCKFAIAVKG